MLAELIPGLEESWEFAYSAPVIKEREFRLDGLFKPLSDNPQIPLVFAEAQMQTDRNFYGRYFAEVFLYLEQYQVQNTWRGLLILQNCEQDLGPPLPYEDLLEGRITRLYLSDLQNQQGLGANLALLQLLVLDRQASAAVGKRILHEAETDAEFQRRLTLIEAILANKFPDLTKEVIMQILDLKKIDITQSRFYQEIIQERLQEGLQKGRRNQPSILVLRLLKRRLGELSAVQVEKIQGLSIAELEDLGKRCWILPRW
ncbi:MULTISPECIES: Rpn family recombination-promoting nuclease/putative transposase [unclassified Synechocystis]|uniref:Rpn family recombination-promoting nuclease/putative transposase n=1 Tax=unclassified Synechocystis TaxID=2640012 RepID=UPI001CBAA866|nr:MULTISPECIES: Rpn family recombination-promoting nuclease/putative transposase [unclassified Synechocystis]